MDPSSSSIYRTQLATGSAVPFGKSYAELTPEQQKLIKSQYQGMADGDEPPYPRDGLAALYKAVWAGQKVRLAEGQLSIVVDVDALGNATSASVFRTPDIELAKYVAGVLMNQKYKPGICQGSPCAMAYPFQVNFAVR